MTAHISIPSERVADFCERWQVVELALFGSSQRANFGPESDIDLLVEFDERARHTLFDMGRMERELESLFGREVDLIERASIEQSDNYLRRKSIFQLVETIYAA